jgi:sugar lactone lactonase YvrE
MLWNSEFSMPHSWGCVPPAFGNAYLNPDTAMNPFSFIRLIILSAALFVVPIRAEKIVLVAGGTEAGTNIPAINARLMEPFGVDFDASGNMFIIEMVTGNRLLKVDPAGKLTHVAGQPGPGDSGDDGPALAAQFHGPHNLAVLPNGDVLIGDTWNGRVRRIQMATGRIATVPGYGVARELARTGGPFCIALDPAGTQLYIADLRQVQALDLSTGKLRRVAGNGEKGVPADGAVAVSAPLVDPRAIAADSRGNLYILERNGHALRVVGRDGRIRTVINASGVRGADGDGGDALAAKMNGPKHLCVDHDDNVIIADAENHLIRKYIPATGKIVRVAGTGKAGEAGVGGPPEQCELRRPHGVTVHRDGTLYITDSYNNRVLKIVR